MRLTYRFFGGEAGQSLPALDDFAIAKHTKGNKDGIKAARPAIRVVNKGQFTAIDTTAKLAMRLFGLCEPPRNAEDATVA